MGAVYARILVGLILLAVAAGFAVIANECRESYQYDRLGSVAALVVGTLALGTVIVPMAIFVLGWGG
jgi:hypothetical protein